MLEFIENFVKIFLDKSKEKKICLIGHYDTDGITSTAIITKTLERLEKIFTTKILKQLTQDEIIKLPKDKILIFVDLGSGYIKELSMLKNIIFIIDHHELKDEIVASNIHILNPQLFEEIYNLCSSELAYLLSRQISLDNKDLAYLAILGMIGDTMEKNINKLRNQIIREAEVIVKKGLLIYPSTRPLDKALEYSSRPFIPGITGDRNNICKLLSEAGIEKIGKSYKALIDLNDKEMRDLVTALMLRITSISEFLGNLYLIKFFNKIEDARELSAIINACSRMDKPETALLLCLGNSIARKKAERIYVKYKQHIISGLKYVEKSGNIIGKNYIIINAQDKIRDTIIGTIASILSFSSIYEEGTIIIAMAYNEHGIKVSARITGRNKNQDRNLKNFLDNITLLLGRGESGGHKYAAGCTINIEDEEKFIELVKRNLEYEIIKV